MHQINKTEKKCARRPKHVLRRLGKTVWNMTDSVDTVAKPITVQYQRIKKEILRIRQLETRGFTDMDVWYLGSRGIIRMSQLLTAMEKHCMSSPSGYDDSSRWLKQRTDDELSRWLESTPFWTFLDALEHNDRGSTRKTVRELGIGYCAWREDLKYAAAVLVLTDKWRPNSSDSHYRPYRIVFGTDAACAVTKKTEAEFRRVWRWIGDNIYDLWD